MTPLAYIQLLRDTFNRGYSGYDEMSGGCYKLYLLLKQAYPQAEGYYNGDHVITEIDGIFYDINGAYIEYSCDVGEFLPFNKYGEEYFKSFEETFQKKTLRLLDEE